MTMSCLSKHEFIPLSLAVLVFAVSLSRCVHKPLTLDEAMPFGWNARAINAGGIAVLGQRVAEGSPETVLEIAHPPLYHILLAYAFRLFGETPAAGRMIGVLCLILTVVLLLLIARQIFDTRRAHLIWLVTATMIAVNPYLVQYALLVEIDTSILTLFMAGTIYFFIRHLKMNRRRDLIFTGIALTASFWAKEMTPPVLIAAMFLFLWIHAGFKIALQKTAAFSAIGLGLFAAAWWIFCEWTNVPLRSFVDFTILNKGAQAVPFSHPLKAIMKIKTMLFWLSLPVWLLFFFQMCRRLQALRAGGGVALQDFLFVYLGLMFFYTMIYIPSSTNNPLQKYDYPAMPFMVLVAGAGVSGLVARLSPQMVAVICSAATGISSFYWLCKLADPLLVLASGNLSFRSSTSAILFSPLLLSVIIFKWRRRELSWARATAFAASLVVLPMNAYVALQQTADYTTSPCWENYGERGLAQTMNYLAGRVVAEDEVAVRKDIGFYLNGIAGLENLHWWYPMFRGEREKMKREFETISASGKISFVVLDPYDDRGIAADVIRPLFEPDSMIGDFHVYRRRER